VVKFHRELAARNHGDEFQHVEFASALYAQALADKRVRPALLKEADALISGLPAQMRDLRSVRCGAIASARSSTPAPLHWRAARCNGPRVNRAPLPLFHSSGQPGFSKVVSQDPRHIAALKFEREIHVRFAPTECTVPDSGRARACQGRGCDCDRHRRRNLARLAGAFSPQNTDRYHPSSQERQALT